MAELGSESSTEATRQHHKAEKEELNMRRKKAMVTPAYLLIV
jgi:hypothetical protein